MKKYESLSIYFRRQSLRQFMLSFREIEEILGFPLPRSKKYQAWWSNSRSHAIAETWLDEGYFSFSVDISGERLSFKRGGVK